FNPLRIAVTDRLELQANPLLFFVAPHVDARFSLIRSPVFLTAEAGLLVPTFGMRLMKGYFFPTWGTSSDTIGWMLIPRLGLVLSGANLLRSEPSGPPGDVHVLDAGSSRPGGMTGDVWTVKLDAAFRVPFGPTNAGPLNSFLIPLDLLFSAPLTGFCGRLGGAYDYPLGSLFRVRGELNLYVTGSQGNLVTQGKDVGPLATLSPFVVTAHVGLDIAVFKQSRITVGLLFANADQGALAVSKGADGFSTTSRVRSNNFLPTLDYIWAGW
ncbi:MAG: hypothetical protein JNG84_01685, partial [Archangium sp.]|nr:hypothetical protein [Archangium sp.]